MTWIERLLGWLRVERHDIGRPHIDVYLSRWVLWGTSYGDGRKVFLHLFHRGDAEPYFHDHPWPYASVILWGGYWEHSPEGRKWHGPGSVIRRPAEWAHRVELPPGKRCWTLFFPGVEIRSWGFWCASGWIPWRQYAANIDAGKEGCG